MKHLLQEKYDAWNIQHESELREYLGTMQNAADVRTELQALVNSYKRAVPFLQPGRLVQLKSKIDGTPPPRAGALILSLFQICIQSHLN